MTISAVTIADAANFWAEYIATLRNRATDIERRNAAIELAQSIGAEHPDVLVESKSAAAARSRQAAAFRDEAAAIQRMVVATLAVVDGRSSA